MKKIFSFMLIAAGLMISAQSFAEKDWKFYTSVKSGAEVKATVYEDLHFEVQMPTQGWIVDPSYAIVSSGMKNVPSLGVTTLRQHVSNVQTGAASQQVDLSAWLSNAFNFQGATLHGNVIAGGQVKPFTFDIAGIDANGLIVASTDSAETLAAWNKLASQVTPTFQTPDDSYMKVAQGSYLRYGDQQWDFNADVTLFKAEWLMSDMLDSLAAHTTLNTLNLSPCETYKAILNVAEGSILAIGGSLVTFDYTCQITMDCSAACDDTPKSGALTNLDYAMRTKNIANMIKGSMDLINAIIGDVDAADSVGVTVSLDVPQVIMFDSNVEETTANKEVRDQLIAENEGVQSMTLEETNIVPATIGFEPTRDKCIVVILTEISIEQTGGTYVERLNSTTYNVTPKYKDAGGVLQTIPNSEIDAPITFRLPVIAEFAGMMVNVYHKATIDAEVDLVGQFAVQEMNGSYYIELSASEFSYYMIKDPSAQYNRTTTNGMIGTICLPFDIDVAGGDATGAEFYELDYRNNADVSQVTEVSGPEVTTTLLGGKAYLFIADNSGNVHCEWTPGATYHEAADTCAMVGNLASTPVYPALLASATVAPYVVSNTGIILPCGSGAYVPMNRAYLNMKALPTTAPAPGRRIRLTANGAQVVTGIEEVQNAQFRMQSGKMILNGHFVIMKDGKKFNAMGQEL